MSVGPPICRITCKNIRWFRVHTIFIIRIWYDGSDFKWQKGYVFSFRVLSVKFGLLPLLCFKAMAHGQKVSSSLEHATIRRSSESWRKQTKLLVGSFDLSGSCGHQWERIHTYVALLSAYTHCNAKARTCARFYLFKKILVIKYSRGIASIVDCYLSYFICVDIYLVPVFRFSTLYACCSTDEVLWIISRIEAKLIFYQVPCSLNSIVPSCPWLEVKIFFFLVFHASILF